MTGDSKAFEAGSMEIGRVTESDLPAIGRLHACFWGEASDVGLMARTLYKLDSEPNHALLAARMDGQCVGTATGVVCRGLYGGSDAYLVVEDVVVDPAYRRNGIATALLCELERFALEHQCNQIIVLTESVRGEAIALYGSAGFEARWTGFKKKLRREVGSGSDPVS